MSASQGHETLSRSLLVPRSPTRDVEHHLLRQEPQRLDHDPGILPRIELAGVTQVHESVVGPSARQRAIGLQRHAVRQHHGGAVPREQPVQEHALRTDRADDPVDGVKHAALPPAAQKSAQTPPLFAVNHVRNCRLVQLQEHLRRGAAIEMPAQAQRVGGAIHGSRDQKELTRRRACKTGGQAAHVAPPRPARRQGVNIEAGCDREPIGLERRLEFGSAERRPRAIDSVHRVAAKGQGVIIAQHLYGLSGTRWKIEAMVVEESPGHANHAGACQRPAAARAQGGKRAGYAFAASRNTFSI